MEAFSFASLLVKQLQCYLTVLRLLSAIVSKSHTHTHTHKCNVTLKQHTVRTCVPYLYNAIGNLTTFL